MYFTQHTHNNTKKSHIFLVFLFFQTQNFATTFFFGSLKKHKKGNKTKKYKKNQTQNQFYEITYGKHKSKKQTNKQINKKMGENTKNTKTQKHKKTMLNLDYFCTKMQKKNIIYF